MEAHDLNLEAYDENFDDDGDEDLHADPRIVRVDFGPRYDTERLEWFDRATGVQLARFDVRARLGRIGRGW